MTNLLTILIGGISLAYILMLAIKKPGAYIWLYLLAVTQFFGFVDYSLVEVSGIINIIFYLNVINVIAILVALPEHFTIDKRVRYFLIITAALTLFGILYPVFLGLSNISSAVIDGKDFFCYSLLVYMLAYKNKIKFSTVYNAVTSIGITLSAIVIVANFTGITPPFYLPVNEDVGIQSGLHIQHATFISLALFLQFIHLSKNQLDTKHFALALILFIGTMLQPHRSLFLTVLPGAGFLLFYKGTAKMKLQAGFCVMMVILSLWAFSGRNLLSETFVKPIQEIMNKEGAIASRNNINEIRKTEISQRPLLGHGFINETSSLGSDIQHVSTNRYNQTLGTVDAGYIDALIRFGIIGTILLLGKHVYLIWMTLKDKRSLDYCKLALVIFMATYFVMSITWSVFTYAHGIIPAAVAIYLIASRPQRQMATKPVRA